MSNGQSMGYVLCTRPPIKIADQYIRKQDGAHLSTILMVRLSKIQMAFKIHLAIQPLFDQTSLVFRYRLCKLYKNWRTSITKY